MSIQSDEKTLPKDQKRALFKLNLKLSTQIEDLLTEFGVDMGDYTFTDEGIRGPAMCHGGQNKTAWSFYSNSSRTWHCWTHQCHEVYGKSCVGLIRAILDCEYIDAWKKGVEFVDKHSISDDVVEALQKKQTENRKQAKENYWADHKNPKVSFPDAMLDSLDSPYEFCQKRKLGYDTMNSYGIGIARRGQLFGRLVIPVRNIEGQIVGFSGRLLETKTGVPKWFHWPNKEFRTGIHLFNIDRAFQYNVKKGTSTYILTEGPFDTIKLEMAGIQNSVCTFGNGISEGQMEVLKQIGATQIYVAYDGDEPGRKGAEKAARKLGKKLFSVGIIDLAEAYPHWPTKMHGALDWANPYVSLSAIVKIMERYT